VPHASIHSTNDAINDVDWYSFTVTGQSGGNVDLDIDCAMNCGASFDPVLALFDSNGTLIAWDDDITVTDPGSAHTNCPAGDFTDSNRHMIAVQANFTPDRSGNLGSTQAGVDKSVLIKTNTIKLTEGPDIQVIDGNACNKGGAELQLPTDPFVCDVNGDGVIDANLVNDPACIGEDLTFQDYRVYLRLVGKLKTGIGVTTCADENTVDVNGDGVVDNTVICSTENVIRVRSAGSKFEDVTRELLTLCIDTLADGSLDDMCDARYGIFDPALQDAFWQWNADGKAHAQLVFVPLPDWASEDLLTARHKPSRYRTGD